VAPMTTLVWAGMCHAADAEASGGPGRQAKPVIQKRGTIDLDLVETTPFVFEGKVYRLEWMRAGSYLRIIDRETGKEVSRFGSKHRFPCAYVGGDTVYVVGTKEDRGWYGNTLTMFISKDLANWTERVIFSAPDYGLCNTSLCKTDDRYVMSIEVNAHSKDRPAAFSARFLESKDLVTWTLTPRECRYAFERYSAPHCLRWHDGWFYLFYLEGGKPRGYEQYIVRSHDLIHWIPSPLNPVLAASPEDKLIANPRLTEEQRARVAKSTNRNNSDIDFCEFNGTLIINYSWGNQAGIEFLAEAEFAGTQAQFLTGWFPAMPATPPRP
jgi:hypothetical protein